MSEKHQTPVSSSNNSDLELSEKDTPRHIENGKVAEADGIPVSQDAAELLAELESLDPQVQKELRRKYDLKILPVVTLIYMMAFIDRSNMGNAKIMGMEPDLALKGNDFNISLTAFFITYVLFEVPANLACKKFGPRIWLSFITLSFGVITMCISFTTSHTGLTIARTVLGIAEAGIMPGITYALGTFYRRHELAQRVGIYASVASIAGGFGGLLATGFSSIPQFGMLHSWRHIFFFEGILTIIAAGICYAALPDSPETARFLTTEEREYGCRRIYLETLTIGKEKLQKYHFKTALCNINTYLLSLGLFCSLTCMNSIALFMPSLLKSMNYTSIQAQLMSVPPYVFGSIVCIIGTAASDRLRSRGAILLALVPFTIIGFALMRGVNIIGVKYFGIFLVTGGSFTSSPLFITWSVDNSAGPMVRAITSAFVVALGSCGGLVATWTYMTTDAPLYWTGHEINLIVASIMLVTSAAITAYCRLENKKRAQGKRDDRIDGLSEAEASKLGHFHPAFRYTP